MRHINMNIDLLMNKAVSPQSLLFLGFEIVIGDLFTFVDLKSCVHNSKEDSYDRCAASMHWSRGLSLFFSLSLS